MGIGTMCQDSPLKAQALDLQAQMGNLFVLGACHPIMATILIKVRFLDPLANQGHIRLELPRELIRAATSTHKLNHSPLVYRRIRWPCSRRNEFLSKTSLWVSTLPGQLHNCKRVGVS